VNTTLNDTLTILAQSLESLRPSDAQPAWAEIIGPFNAPTALRWHPDMATLVGFFAPPDCQAIGAVGQGWARPLEGGPPGSFSLLKPGERVRCKTVFLLTRAGDTAGYLRTGPSILIDEPGTVGRIPDCVRRCLGLPTPPPNGSTDDLLARMWLNDVVGAGREAPAPLAWPGVVRWHPVIKVANAAGITIAPAELLGCLRVGAEAWSWSYLVQQATLPGWVADVLPPGSAGWMDEGILSRWLLGSIADVDKLLDLAKPLVTPAAARKLRLVLKKLGVLEVRHPGGTGVTNIW